ncbi:ABC transporter substrate-binding protein [Actinokineospora soli]|uniref:ABC transporter substrate-binding protein n=1 Tax=Actinokineospora soli TaxID=1048753 RepID=A0ABW2TTB6_9PSEU
MTRFAVPLLALALVACSSPPVAADGVTVRNCGRAQTFAAPPTRVVGLNQHATEMLLALGLADRVVGTAYPDTPDAHPSVDAAYDRVPLLAEQYPTYEELLTAEPDLVVGGYASAFAEKDGRAREALEGKGIRTFLLSEECSAGTTVDTVVEDLRALGRVFGVPDRAEALVSDLTGRVEAVRAKVAGRAEVPVFFYDSGEKSAFTVGGHGLGNSIAALAGGRNVFADHPKSFVDVSWEQVAERSASAVVVVDYLGSGSVAEKQEYLRAHPLASTLPGVAQRRFAVVTLPELTEGIRFPDAVEAIARVLHPGAGW